MTEAETQLDSPGCCPWAGLCFVVLSWPWVTTMGRWCQQQVLSEALFIQPLSFFWHIWSITSDSPWKKSPQSNVSLNTVQRDGCPSVKILKPFPVIQSPITPKVLLFSSPALALSRLMVWSLHLLTCFCIWSKDFCGHTRQRDKLPG